MNFFTLPLAGNTVGSDPVTHLYKAITTAFPTFGLTRTNSKILKIQPAVTVEHPTRTYLLIQKGDDLQALYEFFYLRYDINNYLTNPIFTQAEATQAAALPDSVKLVAKIATKKNLNFRADDFWTSINSLDLSGGTNPPNWQMKAVYDSIFWCGTKNIWLHT